MKISITCITPVLQAILDFLSDIISFQHVFHLGVGRSQIEWKLKAKTQISVFPGAKIGQNDHSNPYIESTTALSDIYILYVRTFWPPGGPALRANVAGQITRASTLYLYMCTYVCIYTWSKLAYCESNNASHGNDKRGYREATETPRGATEAPRRPRRSPLSPTKATEIIAKTALQIPAF